MGHSSSVSLTVAPGSEFSCFQPVLSEADVEKEPWGELEAEEEPEYEEEAEAEGAAAEEGGEVDPSGTATPAEGYNHYD